MKKFFLIFLVFLLAACAKPVTLQPPLQISERKPQFSVAVSEQPKEKEEKKIEPLSVPELKKTVPEKPLPPIEPLDPKILLKDSSPVMLNVEGMPLSDFIIYAIGDVLKVGFVIDEEVKNMKTPVTIRMPRMMEPAEVLEIVVEYLRKQGLDVYQRDGALFITKSKIGKAKPSQIRIGDAITESNITVMQVVPLKYLRVHEIEWFVREMFKDLDVKNYPKENALLLSGQAFLIKEALDFISLIDVPYLTKKKLSLFRLTYWQAEDFIKQISVILTGIGFNVVNQPKEPGILFVPVKVMNSVIVICPDEEALNYVLEWCKKLDTPEALGAEEKAFIYKPLYSNAKDLAESLRNLYGTTVPTPPQQPSVAPTQQAQRLTQVAEKVKVSYDAKRNILLVITTPATYQNILNILKDLDTPPKQVLIEATIAEFTLKDELKFGVEWYLKNKMLEGTYVINQTFGVPKSPGLTYTFTAESEKISALINLFASKGLTNILSTPRVMVMDNEEATIQIGTDIPIITGEVATATTAGATTGIVRSIQYRSTGVILRVKPSIHTEGLLSLNITQEVSEMGTAPPGIESPTVLIRKINTNVIASHGETIVLGGLISNTRGKEESKVPLFGDIPLIGNLFKSTSDEERKTELIVLLRVYILTSPEETRSVTEELKKQFKWLNE